MGKAREFFKQSPALTKAVHKVRATKEAARRHVKRFKAMVNPLKANKQLYMRNHGVEPDLENPKNFNEKVMWLVHNVYKNDPRITSGADKYEMRDYVKSKGLGDLLPDVYGVWKNPKKIDWDSLPDTFVLKCNHGCGTNVFCRDKSKLDKKAAVKNLKHWLHINYANFYGEINYKHINRRVFAEEFLDDGTGAQPVDWKFMCFHGEPKILMVCTERETGAKFIFTDMEYNDLHITAPGLHFGGTLPPKPDTLPQMIEYARKLSEDFPFVRVDFYTFAGKVYVGELTFSPLGCAIDYITDDALMEMGSWLDLSAYGK